MDRAVWWCVVVAIAALAIGCGDDDGIAPGTDAGPMVADAGPADDAGEAADAGPVDAEVPTDAPVASCDPGCGEDEACVRGVCVATCGASAAEIAAWDASLADGLVPIASVCRVPGGPIAVVGARVYEVSASTTGTTTTFTLSRWTLDPAVSEPTLETIATTTHEGHASDMLYAGGYLAISPDEMRAIFGYTTTDEGVVGGVFDVALAGGAAAETGANGNFDGAWLDASTYVINGLGIAGEASAGQGLYTRDVTAPSSRRAVDEMGPFSGSVAVSGDVVIAGALAGFGTTWPDASEGGRVFVISRDDVLASGAPVSAWDDAEARFEAPSTFTLVGGRRLVSAARDDSWNLLGLEARALTESGGVWSLGEPEALTTGAAFTGVVAVGEDRVLLAHGDGLLLVE